MKLGMQVGQNASDKLIEIARAQSFKRRALDETLESLVELRNVNLRT